MKKTNTPAPTAEKKIRIKLPKIRGEEAKLVVINGRNWVIPRGVEWEVPECVADVIADSERMLEEIDRFNESVRMK